MRRTPVARCTRRIVPAAVAAALAAGLPCAAEARMGGGGGLGGLGGFGLGGFHGGGFGLGGLGGFRSGGFAPGGVVLVPRGAVGVVGTAQRNGIGVFSTAQRDALGFRNSGVVVFRGGHAFPHGDVSAFGGGHRFPHGYGDGRSYPSYGYGWGYGTVGVPPSAGLSVPPLATATAPRSGSSAGPLPIRSGVGVAEVWRWDGGAWRLGPTPPQSVAVWRRGDDGRWRAEAAD